MITTWQTWMQAEGLSERTVNDWAAIVRRAAAATGQHPAAFTAAGLTGYLAGFRNLNTKGTYYRGLSAFHQWLVRTGRRDDDPMADMNHPKVPRGEPHPVSTAGLERLLSIRLNRRTRAMILLAAYQGLRVHEIARVRAEDLDHDEATIRVLGKGAVDATLPLHPLVAALAVHMPRRGWWFPSPKDKRQPVNAGSVSWVIAKAMTRAGVRGSAHSLRHWHATALLEAGADAVTVQRSMRHASLATTQIYTRVTDDRLRDAIGRLPHPGAPAGARQPSDDTAAMLAELRALRALLAGERGAAS